MMIVLGQIVGNFTVALLNSLNVGGVPDEFLLKPIFHHDIKIVLAVEDMKG